MSISSRSSWPRQRKQFKTPCWAEGATEQPCQGKAGPKMDRSLDSQWPERAHNSIAAPRIHKSCSAHESCTPPAHRGKQKSGATG